MRKLLVFLLLLGNAAFSQVNLNLGLRAYYPFSGNANDVSGNNNNPAFNNATPAPDRFGNPNSAYLFNGIDNYMRIPNSASLNTTNQISIATWIKVNGFYSGPCHGNNMIMKGDDNSVPGHYFLRFDDFGFTNGQNCAIPAPDPAHQNFYGRNTTLPPNGYTPFVQSNQWTSVIYTYDGTTAKVYVNCVLVLSSVTPGLTFTNTHDLFFGRMNLPAFPYWLNGALDEIRIYDRAINTDEVAALGECAGSIINNYSPVLGFNICENKIAVEDATAFNTGDTVLMIQMKGAVIDSTNTAAFGTITDYKNSGNYEFNYVKSKTGNVIELKNFLTRQYDIPAGKVQLIRVPYYTNITVASKLSCLPWDGSKGGVLVFNVQDSILLNANIDVSGKGFRGGIDPVSNPGAFNCYENQFYYPANPDLASGKGEGIAEVSVAKSFGKGALANGGGSGNSHNSGGGGGSNAATGGFGGYNLDNAPCNVTVPFDNRGIGGKALTYSNAANKIFMGGGGGAGHTNNPEAFQALGGAGSGIVIISANKIRSNGFQILANGAHAPACGNTGSGCHEGMGGGGAGGTVLLKINTYADVSLIQIQGGNGANMTAATFGKVGPGGGGGGGAAWFTNPSLPVGGSVTTSGGGNGVCTAYSNDPWGTTPGQPGSILFNLSIPVDLIPFKPNIDSVRIKDSATSCMSIDFKGLGYTNTSSIASWQWYFGDGGTALTQNTSHTYSTQGTFLIKLVVTDINGCKDSATKSITVVQPVADAGNNASFCAAPSPVSVALQASAGTSYVWAPALFLNNPNIQNPVASITSSTVFSVTITYTQNCTATDQVTITLIPPVTPSITITSTANNICQGNTVTFTASTVNGGSSPIYQWLKNGNPVGTNSNTYTDAALNNGDIIKCRLTSSMTCVSPASIESNSITMTVSSAPGNLRYPTVTAISNRPLQLQARTLGGTYSWQPVVGLSNPLISNPVFNHNQSQEYRIYITTPGGCPVVDTILVKIDGQIGIYVPKAFSPDGNGINDRLYPILVGIPQLKYFRVYNRWGNLIFETNSDNPAMGWDGKYKGFLQPVETYTWVAEGIDINGAVRKKSGNTILMR